MLSDQFVWEGVYVPFFGKVTGTTPLPALLRKRAGADMVAIAVRTDAPGHWIADMGNVVDFSRSDGSLAGDTIEVNRGLETLIRESVLDVFWMHHRWKSVDRFAPQDKKTAALLENMELKPYRILVAVPRALDEALATVPLIRALKTVRCDMQVNIVCPSAQLGIWKTVPEVTHVLPHDSLKQLREALAADEFYNDGPLDLGVMLDGDMETLKALEPYGPMMFSGLDTHPGARKYKFRVKAPVLRAAPPAHRVQLYLQLGGLHGLDVATPSLFPVKKAAPAEDAPILIAPFSRLGSASEWSWEQWRELVSLLPGRTVLAALEEDRERAASLAEHLNVELAVGCAGGSLSRHGRRCGGSSRGWRLSVPLFFPGTSGGDSVFHPGFRMFTALWAHSTVPFTATSAVLPASGRNVTVMFPATATLPCGTYWKPCGKFPGKNNLGRDGMPSPALAEKWRECCRCRKE